MFFKHCTVADGTWCYPDQVDPYVKVSVRDNRIVRTKTLQNNNKPQWNETFSLIVDDPDTQSITFVVMDDDFGAFDDVSGRH